MESEGKVELMLHKKLIKTYAVRNRLLRDIGYKTYADYLASDEWKEVKLKAKAKGKDRCEICGTKDNLNYHHKKYGGIKNGKAPLVCLCRTHHEECHRFISDLKLELKKGTNAYLKFPTLNEAQVAKLGKKWRGLYVRWWEWKNNYKPTVTYKKTSAPRRVDNPIRDLLFKGIKL